MDDSDWDALLQGALLAWLEKADEGALVFDKDALCRMMGRRVGELFGVDPSAHVGLKRDEVLRALAQASSDPDAFLAAVSAAGSEEPERVATLDLERPQPRRVVWSRFPIDRDGGAIGTLDLVRDVTRETTAERKRKELEERVEELSGSDALTGLLTRKRFLEQIEREHGRSARAWDSYAVLRVDVDGMSELNAELGTAMGDSVLEAIAACLCRSKREYDVLARYEGDDFAALLPGADALAAKTVADRFVAAVKAHPFLMAGSLSVSVGGCVWVPPSGEGAPDVFRRATHAMTEARASGKGSIHIDTGAE